MIRGAGPNFIIGQQFLHRGYDIGNASLALVLAVATVLVFSSVTEVVTAQEGEEQSKLKLTLELVSEESYDGPVGDLSIAMSTSGKSYPNVVIAGNKVFIYDEENRKVSELAGLDRGMSFFTISESGSHIIRSWQYASESAKELEQCIVSVYDLSGRLLWETPNIAPARFPLLAADGMYLIAPSYSQVLWARSGGSSGFLNPFGFVEGAQELRRVFLSISPDSKYWAVSCGGGTVVLCTYDSSAKRLWSKLLEQGGAAIAGPVAVARNVEYIGVIYPEGGGAFVPLYFHMLDKNGKLLWKKEIHYRGDYEVLFAPANQYVLVVSGSRIYAIDTRGAVKWEFPFPDDFVPQYFWNRFEKPIAMDISHSGRHIALGMKSRRGSLGYVFLFDGNKGFLAKRQLDNTEKSPLPRFAQNELTLFVGVGNKIQKYSVLTQSREER